MTEPELYVPASQAKQPTRWGLGLARLSFVCGAIVVAFCLLGSLLHLGEPQARGWFQAGLFIGLGWWGVHRALAWVGRGFKR